MNETGERTEAARPEKPVRLGLAMAGGGPEGAVYEIGALRALDEAIEGVDFSRLPVYVGVSAGAFVAACLANGLTTGQLCRAVVSPEPGEHPFSPEMFLSPAFGEMFSRATMLPRLLVEAVGAYLSDPTDLSLTESLTRFARALPTGMFESEPIRRFLERIFSIKGRTDDFRELRTRLIVVAADLDSGQAVRFGENGLDHIPISRAVQASTALPGLYPPVLIEDRYYADGVLLKTVHASVALDHGVDLLFCLNPIVPVDTAKAVEEGVMRRGKLVDRGLPTVVAQSLRTLIYSRMQVGMATYRPRYPHADILLVEPSRQDYRMFFTNVFSFSERKEILEHAYASTLAWLRENRARVEPLLERHGLRLRESIVADESRSLWETVGIPERGRRSQITADLERVLGRLELIVDDMAAHRSGTGSRERG